MTSRLIDISPEGYEAHAIHADGRTWAETNCYLDLWVEILHSLGLDPVPAAACALSARFDGSQWTFIKFKTEDLFALYGIDVGEMNVWRPVLAHVEDNLAAGMLSTVEVDAYWLPDTAGIGYHEARTKTTIVANYVDREAHVLEYFHNSGYHRLVGEDFRGVFGLDHPGETTFTPYVEQIRFEGNPRYHPERFDAVVRRHVDMRPTGNPVRDLGKRVVADVPWIRESGVETFHLWTFGVLRQCGAGAELAADLCEYLGRNGFIGAAEFAPGFREVAQGAKSVQFQVARAARGRSVDPSAQLDAMADAWECSMDGVAHTLGRV
ncbi:DUF1839 family protein [Rhodococcus marinonascens]|uniref:DUF1839 family protein n=1 Tax=Rhodococcus marinonascens TaxID=38311 RepID=UPI000934D9DE|nr:DUF1839 family protein [Rhodococcus marinonascens]